MSIDEIRAKVEAGKRLTKPERALLIERAAEGLRVVNQTLNDWYRARAELATMVRDSHPDITDPKGRVWTWFSQDLYVHDGITAPEENIPAYTFPGPMALNSPAYDLCEICVDGRTRNIRVCNIPDWTCPHAVCARLRD